jgi:GDP-4-dehydro-6-deoxy-D-mannose reductase
MEESLPSRVLITGITGFLGTYLVAQCHACYPDAQIFGICRHAAAPVSGETNEITLIEADITHPEHIRHALAQSRPDWVFHLAAQSSVAASWADPSSTLRINAGGAVQLLEALRAELLSPRVILVGSGEQYGQVRPEENPIHEEVAFRPVNPYGVSKAAQDLYGYQYFVAYGLPTLRVRLFNSFGPRQTETFVVANFARQIALIEQGQLEPVIAVGNLEARRDFLAANDVASALLAVARRGQLGHAYNIASGQARSIRAMLDTLLTLAAMPIHVRQDPARLRPADIPLLVADTSRLHAHTGWRPTIDIEDALEQTLNYWRSEVAHNYTLA